MEWPANRELTQCDDKSPFLPFAVATTSQGIQNINAQSQLANFDIFSTGALQEGKRIELMTRNIKAIEE